jgi:hypothetical protein
VQYHGPCPRDKKIKIAGNITRRDGQSASVPGCDALGVGE